MGNLKEQAKCEIKVKLLTSEVYPLRTQNKKLTAQVTHLEYKLFKQELTTYGVGILGIVILFLVARKAFQFKYRKEFEVEITGKKYEETFESGMDQTPKESNRTSRNRIHEDRICDGPTRSALSDARRSRRERVVKTKY